MSSLNDHPSLPPITIVENGALWQIIVHLPFRSPYGSTFDWSKDLDEAVDLATTYLYNFIEQGFTHPTPHWALTDLPAPPPVSRRAALPRSALYKNVYLSDKAYNYLQRQCVRYQYDGRSSTAGLSHYLIALLKANPTTTSSDISTYWRDTRDPFLKDDDASRIAQGKFPYWTPSLVEDDPTVPRSVRAINAPHWHNAIAPALLKLSNHFLIANLRGRFTPDARAAATLEAIGWEYLTPTKQPPINPNPVGRYRGKKDYHNYSKNKWELVF